MNNINFYTHFIMQRGKNIIIKLDLSMELKKLYTKFYEIQMTPLDTDPKLEIPM